MQDINILDIITNHYKSETDTRLGTDLELIDKIIITRGRDFVEQKFLYLVRYINNISKKTLLPSELYVKIFPDLIPKVTTIDRVTNNALENIKNFIPIYHTSENVFREWVHNFYRCCLIEKVNEDLIINIGKCKQLLQEFRKWVVDYPDVKGSSIRSHIKWDLGELPIETPIIYNPKNITVRKEILEQLENHHTLKVTNSNDPKNLIEMKLRGSDIVLKRTARYPVTAEEIQKWLSCFGINLSTTSTTHLIEFGMPYAGNVVSLGAILHFTNRGCGVIGLLAYQLDLQISRFESGQKVLEKKHHPLGQSVIWALARLEQFLNPTLF